MQPQVTEAPQTHTLRVAVFDFHSGELLSRDGTAPLFIDEQPIDERGFTGLSHEQRATLITKRHGLGNLALKTLGGRISVHDGEELQHDGYAVRTSDAIPYTFLRSAMYKGRIMRRATLEEVYTQVHLALSDTPERSSIDTVDAMILDKASTLFNQLADYRR